MGDPLLQVRQDLQRLHQQAIMPRSQGDLFGSPAAPAPEPPV